VACSMHMEGERVASLALAYKPAGRRVLTLFSWIHCNSLGCLSSLLNIVAFVRICAS
jgi:hypothetical protein